MPFGFCPGIRGALCAVAMPGSPSSIMTPQTSSATLLFRNGTVFTPITLYRPETVRQLLGGTAGRGKCALALQPHRQHQQTAAEQERCTRFRHEGSRLAPADRNVVDGKACGAERDYLEPADVSCGSLHSHEVSSRNRTALQLGLVLAAERKV